MSELKKNGLAKARFSYGIGGDRRLNWNEIIIHTHREAEEALYALLIQLGTEGVVVEDSEVLSRRWELKYGEIIELKPEDYPEYGIRIKAYLSEYEQEKVPRLIEEIKKHLEKLRKLGLNVSPGKVEAKVVSEASWEDEWKKYYKAFKVSDRLVIKPIWEDYDAAKDEIVIEIDPGMAFGTGSHPTTILSILALEKWMKPESKVIDVGCGSGVLSIVASKLGAKEVLALDLDPIAVESTKRNISYNAIEGKIRVEQGDLLKNVSETADLVVGNLLAEIILQMTHDLPRVLRPGGIFIGSGIIKKKEEEVIQKLKSFGMQVLEVVHQGEWVAITAKKW